MAFHDGAESPGCIAQHGVAGCVAQRVIDGLEAGKIEGKNCHRASVWVLCEAIDFFKQSQAIEQEIGTERFVIAATRSAYAQWQAANQVIASSRVAVDANKLALDGVRAENSVGTRTILDILDAERELLNSQVQLVTAERNAYVAGFSLLASMGQAEARDLGLDGGALYDPAENYRRVKGIFWDWDQDAKPVPQATRTVDSRTQTSETPAKTGN